jgi:hypothetical protein
VAQACGRKYIQAHEEKFRQFMFWNILKRRTVNFFITNQLGFHGMVWIIKQNIGRLGIALSITQ